MITWIAFDEFGVVAGKPHHLPPPRGGDRKTQSCGGGGGGGRKGYIMSYLFAACQSELACLL